MTSTPANAVLKANVHEHSVGSGPASAAPTSLASTCFWLVAAQFVWLIPSSYYVQKYAGRTGLVLVPFLATLAILIVRECAVRWGPEQSRFGVAVLCVTVIALFFLVYPIANSGLLGPGSDRDDALNVALQALLSGQSPYGATTYLGNTPTPMAGALVLALPFYALGNSALQNAVWLAVFIWWCLRYFGDPKTAFVCIAIFFVGCPASLADFLTGGDYLVNTLYVAIAVATALRAQHTERPWYRYAAAIFFAIAISSRPIYLIALVVAAGSTFRVCGIRRTLELVGIVGLVCALLNGPFLLYDPSHFPTVHLLDKLTNFPQSDQAKVVLPSLGLAVASLSFLVRVEGSNVFGLVAVAMSTMFYPIAIFDVMNKFDTTLFWVSSFSLPVTIFAGIWISERLTASRLSVARLT